MQHFSLGLSLFHLNLWSLGLYILLQTTDLFFFPFIPHTTLKAIPLFKITECVHHHYPYLLSCCCPLGGFLITLLVNRTPANMGIKISFFLYTYFIFFGYILSKVIATSYSGSIFNSFRNLHAGFHKGYPNLYSHLQCTKVSPFPHLH